MSSGNIFGILINDCYGGFVFSKKFIEEYEKLYGIKIHHHNYTLRDEPQIIELFNKLGSQISSGKRSELKIIYLPIELKDYYYVDEYDGREDVKIRFDLIYEKLLLESLDESADRQKIKEKYDFFKKFENDF
jgi:hypothetical protein